MQKDKPLGDQVLPSVNIFSSSPSATFGQEPLPSLPIMAATRLQLDLLLNEGVVDLKSVAEVVLADPGATLQILRLIGEEYPDDADRPKRIGDCIASLSMQRCYEVICASQLPHTGAHVAEWRRCRRIAECVREIARNLQGVSPEQAYIVGLLSRLGTFPNLLGWNDSNALSSECEALGVMLAYHWNLPDYVLLALQEQHRVESPSKWKKIVSLAHEFSEAAQI